MELKPVELGICRNSRLCFDTLSASNKHMLLLGKPGSGKSVQTQKIMLELCRQEKTILLFDIHSVAAEEQIFPGYRAEFMQHVHEVDVYESGICCNLFQPAVFPDGGKEKQVDTVNAIVSVLSSARRFGVMQQSALRAAVTSVAESGRYETDGFMAVDAALAEAGTVYSETVREKLYSLTAHNVFRAGQFFISPGKINIIRISKFDMETQVVITEVLLSYLWRMAAVSGFSRDGLFIVLDECQNFISGERCMVNQILSEGRKFSLNLILATQGLGLKKQAAMSQKIMQSGLVLFFQPDMSQVHAQAKLIDMGSAQEWATVLQRLKPGEFVALGSLSLGGITARKPLKASNRL